MLTVCVCGQMKNTWRMALIIPANIVAISGSKVKSTATVKTRFLADERAYADLVEVDGFKMVRVWELVFSFLLFMNKKTPVLSFIFSLFCTILSSMSFPRTYTLDPNCSP